jgi:hypothetical protein
MTSAALHASCLSAYLNSGPRLDEPARTYFADIRVIVDAAWQISTTADLALPHVDGPYPRGYRVVSGLGNMVFAMSAVDQELNRRMTMVTTMRTPARWPTRPCCCARCWAGSGTARRPPERGLRQSRSPWRISCRPASVIEPDSDG